MGGAGIALTDDLSTASVINPAAAAANGARFRFIFPSFDLNTRGASLSDLRDRTSNVSGGGTDDALELARTFGRAPTVLNVGFVTGFAGGVGLTAEGEAQGLINPGRNFSDWVGAGLPETAADLQANVAQFSDAQLQADILAATLDGTLTNAEVTNITTNYLTTGTNVQAKLLYSVPSINFGTGFDTKGGKLWVGTKMRWLQGETHTWTMQQKAGVTDRISLEAVEDQTKRTDDSGFGADLGFVFQPENSIMQFGMVINNAIEPNLAGIPTPSMLSLGMASQPNARLRYAVDLVNINKAYNEKTRLRMGAEWTITRNLQLRAGNSGEGWTYGFGIFGMNFAFSDDAPNMISRALRF
jgi:hypothetical protein